MNKESSNTMVRRGRSLDKFIIFIGAILIVGVISFAIFGVIHSNDTKTAEISTEQTINTNTSVSE